jgi:hypothetical protein
MLEHRHMPDRNRLSVISAIILLAYALARLVEFPVRELEFQLPGIYLATEINIRTIIALLVAGLAATGTDWLLRSHPHIKDYKIFEHWILPALTAYVIGLPLYQLAIGFQWWLGFAIGGAILVLVLVAEYISLDPDDVRHPAASLGLTTVSFALFLTLAIVLRYSGLRLFLTLPALTLAAGLVSLRTLHLRSHGQWAWVESATITIVCAQIIASLHYLPISPVMYGLLLIGPAYAITSLIANLADGNTLRASLIEPAIVLVIVIGTALWIG